MIAHCEHNDPNGPVAVSLTADFPNVTCDLCERRQERLSDLASDLLGENAPGPDLTRFRKACNVAIARKCPPLSRCDLSVVESWHAADYVWNDGQWRDRAAELLGEL
jgi:hypothetical protein